MQDQIAYTLAIALAIIGYILGIGTALIADRRQRQAHERQDATTRQTLRNTSSILEDLGILTNKNLAPLGPAISKAVAISILSEGSLRGWAVDSRELIAAVERTDPALVRAWSGLVPDEASRIRIVEDVVKVACKMRADDTPGLHLGDDLKVPYARVSKIVDSRPFSRLARWTRSPWWNRILFVVVGLGVLPSLLFLTTLVYYPPVYAWFVGLPLLLAAGALLVNRNAKRAYQEECIGRWEYMVMFAPGHFLPPPTAVHFGHYCPAGIFVPSDDGFGFVRIRPGPGWSHQSKGE